VAAINCRVHGILEAVAHLHSPLIFDVHVELADILDEKVHDRAVSVGCFAEAPPDAGTDEIADWLARHVRGQQKGNNFTPHPAFAAKDFVSPGSRVVSKAGNPQSQQYSSNSRGRLRSWKSALAVAIYRDPSVWRIGVDELSDLFIAFGSRFVRHDRSVAWEGVALQGVRRRLPQPGSGTLYVHGYREVGLAFGAETTRSREGAQTLDTKFHFCATESSVACGLAVDRLARRVMETIALGVDDNVAGMVRTSLVVTGCL
jgi:hypothetical protein